MQCFELIHRHICCAFQNLLQVLHYASCDVISYTEKQTTCLVITASCLMVSEEGKETAGGTASASCVSTAVTMCDNNIEVELALPLPHIQQMWHFWMTPLQPRGRRRKPLFACIFLNTVCPWVFWLPSSSATRTASDLHRRVTTPSLKVTAMPQFTRHHGRWWRLRIWAQLVLKADIWGTACNWNHAESFVLTLYKTCLPTHFCSSS